MNITRRGALGLLFAAPAIVKVGSLMPIKVIRPEPIVPYVDADGWHHYVWVWDDKLGATTVYRDGLKFEYAIDVEKRDRSYTRSLWRKENT